MSVCLEQTVPFPLKLQKARIHGVANRVERIFNVFEVKQFYEGFCHTVHDAFVYIRSCLIKLSALMIFIFLKLVCIYHFLL